MVRTICRSTVAVVSLALLVGLKIGGQTAGQPSTKNGDWTSSTWSSR